MAERARFRCWEDSAGLHSQQVVKTCGGISLPRTNDFSISHHHDIRRSSASRPGIISGKAHSCFQPGVSLAIVSLFSSEISAINGHPLVIYNKLMYDIPKPESRTPYWLRYHTFQYFPQPIRQAKFTFPCQCAPNFLVSLAADISLSSALTSIGVQACIVHHEPYRCNPPLLRRYHAAPKAYGHPRRGWGTRDRG